MRELRLFRWLLLVHAAGIYLFTWEKPSVLQLMTWVAPVEIERSYCSFSLVDAVAVTDLLSIADQNIHS